MNLQEARQVRRLALQSGKVVSGVQLLYRGADPVRLRGVLEEHLPLRRLEIVGSRPLDARVSMGAGSSLAVYDIGYGTDVMFGEAPTDCYLIRLHHAGIAWMSVDGTATLLSPSLVNPGQTVEGTAYGNATVRLLRIPVALVDDTARAVYDPVPELPLALDTDLHRTVSSIQWVRMARAFAALLEDDLTSSFPLAVRYNEQALVHMLLAVQPDTAQPGQGRRQYGKPLSCNGRSCSCCATPPGRCP